VANKYGAKRTNGYHSAREAKRAAELKLLERSGEITDLREQVPIELLPKQVGERGVKIILDFTYRENGTLIAEDCKGMRTPQYILKRKMLQYFHGLRIRET
jgi:hypothetical protein